MNSPSSPPALKIARCDFEAARYAVMRWHYSQKMPSGKLVKYGVWEGGKFIGAVLYGRGGNNRLGSPYGLEQTEICELVRVALTAHVAPVSRILAYTLKQLKRDNPGLRLVVSYADPKQGHHGGIYQATNWLYTGHSQAQKELIIGGVFTHKRTANALYGTASPEKIQAKTGKRVTWSDVEFKLTYLYPLDDEMRSQLAPLKKPYPKRERAGSVDSDTPAFLQEKTAHVRSPRPTQEGTS